MIKRFHYFKPEISSFEDTKKDKSNSDSRTVKSPSKSILSTKENDLYEISYRISNTLPSVKIQIPANFTVLQDHCETNSSHESTSTLTEQGKKNNKIRVFLVGSEVCPNLTSFVHSSFPVDRIEFYGSIKFEKPIFEMISRLQELRKVKFFLSKRQKREWECDSRPHMHEICVNHSVTSLGINVSRKLCRKNNECETTCESGGNVDVMKQEFMCSIERMVVRILTQISTCFPSLRKLTVAAPNTIKIHDAIFAAMNNLKHLKSTIVECSQDGDQIIVTKAPPPSPPKPQEDKKAVESVDKTEVVAAEMEIEIANDTVLKDESDTEPPATLTGMGKILESMLGIGDSAGVEGSIENSSGKERNNTMSDIFSKMYLQSN